MNINALYESVTNSIITEMEAGAVPWVKPWKTPRNHGSVMPHNLATGRAYSGINIPLLWGAADKHGYATHEWMTFQQARMHGATVRAVGQIARQFARADDLPVTLDLAGGWCCPDTVASR